MILSKHTGAFDLSDITAVLLRFHVIPGKELSWYGRVWVDCVLSQKVNFSFSRKAQMCHGIETFNRGIGLPLHSACKEKPKLEWHTQKLFILSAWLGKKKKIKGGL